MHTVGPTWVWRDSWRQETPPVEKGGTDKSEQVGNGDNSRAMSGGIQPYHGD